MTAEFDVDQGITFQPQYIESRYNPLKMITFVIITLEEVTLQITYALRDEVCSA